MRLRVGETSRTKAQAHWDQIWAVGIDRQNMRVWLEINRVTDQGREYRSYIRVELADNGRFEIQHKCPAVDKGLPCWHLGMATILARRAFSIPALKAGSEVVDVEKVDPPCPTEALDDLTLSVVGVPRHSGARLPMTTDANVVPQFDIDDEPEEESADSVGNIQVTFESLKTDGEREVMEYLLHEGVPMALCQRVLAARRPEVPQEYQDRVPKRGKFTGNLEILMQALTAFVLRKPILAEGPASTGKTTLFYTLGWVFNLPLFEINGNLQTEISDLRGDKTLEVDEETRQAVVTYQLGVVTEAMQAGGLAYIDEILHIRPGVATYLNALDWRGMEQIEVPGFGIVKTSPYFRWGGSGNAGYAGSEAPNQALVDRCVVLRMPFTKNIVDILLGTEDGSVPAASMLDRSKTEHRRVAKRLAELFERLQAMLAPELQERLQSDAVLSIRGLIDAADLWVGSGGLIGLRVALRSCLVAKIWDDEWGTDRQKVEQLIDSFFAA